MYYKFLKKIDDISYIGVCASMALMAAIVSAQVILRYFFSYSIDSADELSRLFFVWTIFLSIPHGLKYGSHVGIDFFFNKFSFQIKKNLTRFFCVCILFLLSIVFYTCLKLSIEKWDELMPTLNFSSSFYYISVIICVFHCILHLLPILKKGETVFKL
jgi:TRAP-type C4-dicarboxylate transport system permease small subunit